MSERKYSFKNLELWKMAQALAVDVCKLADGLPRTRSADVIARQVIRSATSIAANIAEGHGRYSVPAYLHHLSIAKGSATETQGWVDAMHRLGHLSDGQAQELDRRYDAMIAAITRRSIALEAQGQKTRAVRDEEAAYDASPFRPAPRFPGSQAPAGGGEVGP